MGGPLWIDAPHFHIADHVNIERLPPGSDDTALLAAIERLRIRPFDRSRPLWQMWLLPGLDGNRIGFYVKMHHTMADGVAGVLLLGAFLDLDPSVPDITGPDVAPVAWNPQPPPTGRDLLVDNISRPRDRGGPPADPSDRVVPRAAHHVALAAHGSRPTAHADHLGEPAHRRDPPHGPGPRRPRRAPSTQAHQHGATVNDVLMTAVAGGYRELLIHRNEPVDGVVLRASVPVSLHDENDDHVANDDGMMFVPLPLDIPDAAARLEWIATRTKELRHDVYRPPSGSFVSSRLAQHVLWSRFDHQRMSNTYVTNIPGPTAALYLAGARVEEVFPVVPILGNITIGIGAMSYAGRFNIVIVADTTTCPDLDIFTAGVADAMAALERPSSGQSWSRLTT